MNSAVARPGLSRAPGSPISRRRTSRASPISTAAPGPPSSIRKGQPKRSSGRFAKAASETLDRASRACAPGDRGRDHPGAGAQESGIPGAVYPERNRKMGRPDQGKRGASGLMRDHRQGPAPFTRIAADPHLRRSGCRVVPVSSIFDTIRKSA